MTVTFKVPETLTPVFFPTESSLLIDNLKIIEARFVNKKKICDFMVSHTNAEYTVRFQVIYEQGRCFASKGFRVSRIHAANPVFE